MEKTNNKKHFWNRWFDNLSVCELEDYLISQAALWEEDRGKYSLDELQQMTFREIFGFEWCSVSTEDTGLPLEIRLDEVGVYRTESHSKQPEFPSQPKLIFINNYINDSWDVIPVTISKTPELLEDETFIKLSHEDVEKVKAFIIKNYDLLMKHWKQEIHTDDLLPLLQKVSE